MSTVEATASRIQANPRPVPGTEDLFTPYRLDGLQLKNRLVLSPMTRSRAIDGNVPSPLAPEYYAQRASAGLQITEASQVSPQGVGYIRTPGMHSPAQVAGWKKITDAVHQAGGVIFAQLWHVGRVSHPDFHNGELPVAPSALPVEGEAFTKNGKVKIVTPRALELHELPGIVAQFRAAAENAKAAGFDGVELHGANGYLLDQFLRDGSNRRTDAYGGSIENRARFPLEVTQRGDRRVGPTARWLQALAALRRLFDGRTPIRSRRFRISRSNWTGCRSATSTSAKRLPVRWRRRPARYASRRSCAKSSAAR